MAQPKTQTAMKLQELDDQVGELRKQLDLISYWIVGKFGNEVGFPLELQQSYPDATNATDDLQFEVKPEIPEPDDYYDSNCGDEDGENEEENEEQPELILPDLQRQTQSQRPKLKRLKLLRQKCTITRRRTNINNSIKHQKSKIETTTTKNTALSAAKNRLRLAKIAKAKTNVNPSTTQLEQIPLECPQCPNKTFKTAGGLDYHLKAHAGIKPYVCDICSKGFTGVANLQAHRRIHTGERPYVCGVCGKRFNQNNAYKRHTKIHANYPRERSWKCEVCSKGFLCRRSLKGHQENLHHVRILTIQNTGVLEAAVANTDGEQKQQQQPQHLCLTCGKNYPDSTTLERHEKLHTRLMLDNELSCEICFRRCDSSKALEQHKRTHNKPISCDSCSKTFTSRSSMMRHKRMFYCKNVMIESTGPDIGQKDFLCETCAKIFRSKKSLNRHKLSCSGNKN